MKFLNLKNKKIINENCTNSKIKETIRKYIFLMVSIISIIIFAICISPVELQNDTFYTIKIGQYIMENGVDLMDHFSWHNALPYSYPHWAYDCGIALIYNLAGYSRNIYINNNASFNIRTVNLFYK